MSLFVFLLSPLQGQHWQKQHSDEFQLFPLYPEQEIDLPLSEVSAQGRGVEGLSSSGWLLARTDFLFCGVSYTVTCC